MGRPDLHDLWHTAVAPKLLLASKRKVLAAPKELFGDVTDRIRNAAGIWPERALAPGEIRAACHYGLSEIFTKR